MCVCEHKRVGVGVNMKTGMGWGGRDKVGERGS